LTSLTGKRSCVTAIIAVSTTITVLCSACHTAAPGTVVDKDLILAESFLIEGSSDPYFAAFTLDQDLWIVGEDQLVRRYPDGRRDLLRVPIDAREAHVRAGQGAFYILEPGVGRIRSFDADGKVLWLIDDLGMVHDVAWNRDRVYALSYPDPFTLPHVIEVVLHAIRLSDGNLTSYTVELPEGVHWEDFAAINKSSSAGLVEADSTVCLSYVAYDDVTGRAVHFLAVPDESGGFRVIIRDWTEKATVLGDTFAYLITQGEWALVAVSLTDGTVLDRACGQAGYRYIAHSIPVPKLERTTWEGPSKGLMYLEG
jgi:hypothetical protein